MPDVPSRPPEPTGGRERAPELAHTVKRHAIGGPTVHYKCPRCRAALHSKLSEAGEGETCPECGMTFTVPGAAEREVEAVRAAASERAAREAERMKEAAKRIERHQAEHRTLSKPHAKRQSTTQPPHAWNRFLLYEIGGALCVVCGFAILLVEPLPMAMVGAIGFAGGLIVMTIAAAGRVLCYCAERLHALERAQKRAQSAGPPSPREGAEHSR